MKKVIHMPTRLPFKIVFGNGHYAMANIVSIPENLPGVVIIDSQVEKKEGDLLDSSSNAKLVMLFKNDESLENLIAVLQKLRSRF